MLTGELEMDWLDWVGAVLAFSLLFGSFLMIGMAIALKRK
jgi:hypothetical protein